ncbi:MAG: PIG-L family deacetylase [Comamonas sp.]
MRAPSLEQRLRGYRTLSVLAPHPDDEVFGGFGLIRLAQQLGLQIDVHIVSDGERCFGALPAPEDQALRDARQQESRAAAALLGCPEPQFWQLGDSQLMEQPALLERQFQNHWRADALYLAPWWHDGHPDHEAVAHCLRRIAAPQHCLYYPLWALVDPPRRAQFLAQPQIHTLTLTPEELRLKKQAAALFQTQFSCHGPVEGAIIRDEFLAAFTTDHEYYLDET